MDILMWIAVAIFGGVPWLYGCVSIYCAVQYALHPDPALPEDFPKINAPEVLTPVI